MCLQSYLGLLFMAVLFCLLTACTSREKTPSTPSSPNPLHYLLFGSPNKNTSQSDTLTVAERQQLQHGDILLRKGFGNISAYIADFLDEPYPVTHCGFIIEQSPQQYAVLHCISEDTIDGLLVEPLEDYIKTSQWSSLVAVRLLDSTHLDQALQYAQQLLAQNIPFDMRFDDHDSEALYCAEMIRDALNQSYQKDFFPKRVQKQGIDVLSMSNFFDTANFSIIFNHFDTLSIN